MGEVQLLDLEPAKASGLIGGQAIPQRLFRVLGRGREAPGEGGPAVGPGLLQDRVGQPAAHQGLELPPEAPEPGFDVEQGHTGAAEEQVPRALFPKVPVCVLSQASSP